MVSGRHEIRLRESGSGIKQRRKRDDGYRGGHSEIVSFRFEMCSYNDYYRASSFTLQGQFPGEIQDWNDNLKGVG